ncbi:abhydrolase domain containing protein 12 [Grosmannia clavigera kw1407]|uniref:Abhydrolase domain containing protein 12 n=1 Tax=Grosmannia clavigera (strain kw1407 / UAMH 11150) TaxID=655863 RepID=F0XAA7_GROCL|nr:abhydrolase domain containing protein 12 [Grosmannia clavigera kw1407]EFX05288.1 abhydrolase domain containing protein 12 [Grosmannia clavigera kw1407]
MQASHDRNPANDVCELPGQKDECAPASWQGAAVLPRRGSAVRSSSRKLAAARDAVGMMLATAPDTDGLVRGKSTLSDQNQVTPFHLTTDDGERIHAWHVLPLPVYLKHEETLRLQPTGYCDDITTADSLRILREDPNAQLVIFFHGNAGHIPATIRAPSFHSLTDTSSFHLLAIDYRGFGQSSGQPSEEGLIRDASAAVDFVLETAGVAPDRVILLGHSLGTAVAVAVAERYAVLRAVDFAGLVLVSGFSSLPTMLSHYAVAGCVPILGPLRSWPRVLQWILGFVVEPWSSVERLGSLVNTVRTTKGRHLRVGLIHAADDWDIPSVEDDKLFLAAVKPLLGSGTNDSQLAAVKEARTVRLGGDAFVTEWRESDVVIRQERFPHGGKLFWLCWKQERCADGPGHNNVMKYAPVVMEVMRIFNEEY